jgi:hypothetical protein
MNLKLGQWQNDKFCAVYNMFISSSLRVHHLKEHKCVLL